MENPEPKTKQEQLPEAAASVTYSVTSKDGFNALFTIRDINGLKLLETMKTIEKVLLDSEYKPQIKQSFGGFKKDVQYVEGKVCPKDGGKLKKIISKKDGKEYWSCANGTFIGGVKGGCDFFTSPANFEKMTKPQVENTGDFDEYKDY